jgi:protocatechuate 3,4-dioxygenase beta subunit
MFVVLGVAMARPAGVASQQTRDTAPQPAAGTALISGVVVDDQEQPRPVRRAVVTLVGGDLRPSRGAITDDDGRFTLRNLPPGRFKLTVERGGFISSVFGAKRPGRAGTDVTVAAGQQIDNLRVRLWRGAVLTGVVRDESGDPLPSTTVAAIPAREITPAALTLNNRHESLTNDLGEFRIFGLEPGTYVIRAGLPMMGPPEIAASESEIDATFAALAARRQPGASAKPGAAITPAPARVSSAPIYYPGTPVPADAMPVTLKAGEERSGLDFAVRKVPIATVRGKIVGPTGAPVAAAFVQLAVEAGAAEFGATTPAPVTAIAGPDGVFTVTPVSPGQYQLLARADISAGAGRAGASGGGSSWWALVPVSTTGDDVDVSTLTLQPGLTISGRVEFDRAATTPPLDPASLRVQLQSESLGAAPGRGRGGPANLRFLQPAAVRADGRFDVTDLVPDTYRVTIAGAENSTWWLRSAIWNRRDLLDSPWRLLPGESLNNVRLLLTDRRTELSGTLTTPQGTAVSDLFVLAFPADPALRGPHSRRTQAVRPDSSGRYVFEHLPAGDYLLCALTDVDEGQWNEPGFLDPIIPSSVKVTLGDGEKKIQDLRLTSGLFSAQ